MLSRLDVFEGRHNSLFFSNIFKEGRGPNPLSQIAPNCIDFLQKGWGSIPRRKTPGEKVSLFKCCKTISKKVPFSLAGRGGEGGLKFPDMSAAVRRSFLSFLIKISSKKLGKGDAMRGGG